MLDFCLFFVLHNFEHLFVASVRISETVIIFMFKCVI